MTSQQQVKIETMRRPEPKPAFATDSDRRYAPRRPSGSTALISADSIDIPMPCLVCDISASGARLYMHECSANLLGAKASLPPSFTLALRADRVEVDCAVVWRKLGMMGVRFLAPTRPLPRRQPMAVAAR